MDIPSQAIRWWPEVKILSHLHSAVTSTGLAARSCTSNLSQFTPRQLQWNDSMHSDRYQKLYSRKPVLIDKNAVHTLITITDWQAYFHWWNEYFSQSSGNSSKVICVRLAGHLTPMLSYNMEWKCVLSTNEWRVWELNYKSSMGRRDKINIATA